MSNFNVGIYKHKCQEYYTSEYLKQLYLLVLAAE